MDTKVETQKTKETKREMNFIDERPFNLTWYT